VSHATKLHGAQAALAAIGSGVRTGRWVSESGQRHQRALDHLLADLREQGGPHR
jgi:hypothetical protein